MNKKPPKSPARNSDAHNALLGDLESLRTLLDADDEPPEPSADDADDVPVLQDMVEGAITINESELASRSSFDDDAPSGIGGLADDTIQALLGDQWRNEARRILADARSTVEGAGGNWSAADLNALNESLKVRIDRTLDDWLVEMMNARIDDLRSRILKILENELEQFTRAVTDGDPPKKHHGE